MKPARHLFDRLILWYLGVMFAVTFVGSYFGLIYLLAALVHLVMIFLVLQITRPATQTRLRIWLRWFYPLLLLLPLHYEIELVGTLFHGGTVYDELVKIWDLWLFRGHPHRYLADILRGPVWREFFNLAYLSYYGIIIGSYWYTWRQWTKPEHPVSAETRTEFPKYAFVFLGAFLTYMLVFILFPVVGPLDDRFLRFHGDGLLGPLIDGFFAIGDSAGGAFPSSHIGEAVVVYLLIRPVSVRLRLLSITVITCLSVATVYGSFHYAIDALGGLISGPLFYFFWSWLYQWLDRKSVIKGAT